MTQILIIEKNGNIKIKDGVKYNNNVNELYKTCGFRKQDGFVKIYNWDSIELWGRLTGKNNFLNNYKFPSPIDKTEIFGNCILIRILDNQLVDMTENIWNRILTGNEIVTSINNININTTTTITSYTDKDNNKNSHDNNKLDNKYDNNHNNDHDDHDDDDDDDDDDDSSDDDDDYGDSELQEEDYIYSSEEEN
uniref:Uncharacterized protein n=1 Tax=viral metagenome TaxID=1070528 RepID=A0A6C0AXT6_9ZZZZ|tara:strand:+ start:5482 stop:6060 length:579 start_codon:yes stop_codon:yes gene_type:complete